MRQSHLLLLVVAMAKPKAWLWVKMATAISRCGGSRVVCRGLWSNIYIESLVIRTAQLPVTDAKHKLVDYLFNYIRTNGQVAYMDGA